LSADCTIKRGNTTTQTFSLPEDIPHANIDKAIVLYSQKNIIAIRKEVTGLTSNFFSVTLSEAETLGLYGTKVYVEVVLHFNDGHVLRSHIYKVDIEDTTLNEEAEDGH
jgi:hypothetical protein